MTLFLQDFCPGFASRHMDLRLPQSLHTYSCTLVAPTNRDMDVYAGSFPMRQYVQLWFISIVLLLEVHDTISFNLIICID